MDHVQKNQLFSIIPALRLIKEYGDRDYLITYFHSIREFGSVATGFHFFLRLRLYNH